MVDVVTQLSVSPGATQHVLDDHADVAVLPAHEEPPSLANTCEDFPNCSSPASVCLPWPPYVAARLVAAERVHGFNGWP